MELMWTTVSLIICMCKLGMKERKKKKRRNIWCINPWTLCRVLRCALWSLLEWWSEVNKLPSCGVRVCVCHTNLAEVEMTPAHMLLFLSVYDGLIISVKCSTVALSKFSWKNSELLHKIVSSKDLFFPLLGYIPLLNASLTGHVIMFTSIVPNEVDRFFFF